MAKARKARLKVFRTSAGFDDAYVAAPSRKAALEAWGSTTDLFSSGAAELVTDPELMKEALARPGEVVRKSRGSSAQHVKALGKVSNGSGSRIKSGMTQEKAQPKAKKPSRAAVVKAEKAVERAKEINRKVAAKLAAAEQALEAARKQYRAAMADWAG